MSKNVLSRICAKCNSPFESPIWSRGAFCSKSCRFLMDLTGMQFGAWRVLERRPDKLEKACWLARCVCGTEKVVWGQDLTTGKSRTCGCKNRVRSGRYFDSRSLEARTWERMKQRCLNPNATGYQRYGGRGITVCDRWLSFANFLADMGPRPSASRTLDRINNDGNYEPGNCRWATPKEQGRNTSTAFLTEVLVREIRALRADGATLHAIARKLGTTSKTIRDALPGGRWDDLLETG